MADSKYSDEKAGDANPPHPFHWLCDKQETQV